jgi:preprotein translocase subunit Sec61beta
MLSRLFRTEIVQLSFYRWFEGAQKVAYSCPSIFFMSQNRISMPASTAGVQRYFEESKTQVQLKPGHVVLLAVVIMLITIILHAFGSFKP